MFVLNIVVIDYLDKIWDSFQILLHLGQGFTINIIWKHMKYFPKFT